LWDLKARLLERPLVDVLDAAHESVPVYGSGGFCSYSDEQLAAQLRGWVDDGIPRVKMKVGREPERDRDRVAAAREAVGDDVELYVDANGALTRRQAAEWSHVYATDFGVTWFEEPVSSDDLEGLAFLREASPPAIEIAAGEYGDVLPYFERMAPAVDCLQADVTRCGGITGLLEVAAVAHAHELDVSAHCAPAVSAHAFCAVERLRHLEYFHDHVRVEHELFDGVLVPEGGRLTPDRSRPGNGLVLK
jgi:L-alanine-DL-glutamate epimerase-like enolase superfamily enzyme